jgi:hypothetical protein
VRLDGRRSDEQALGDLGVAGPPGDGHHHLALPVGEALEPARNGGVDGQPLGELPDEAPGDRRRQQRPAVGHGADGDGQLVGGDVLEHEAAGAGAQRPVDVLVRVEGGQDQHPDVPVGRGQDPGGRLQAVQIGHADVHEDHVGTVPAGHLNRLEPGPGLGDDLDVVVDPQDHGEAPADQCLVVDHGDSDAHAGSVPVGRWATTPNPPPGRGPASRVPPRSRALSRIPTMP